MLYTNPYGLLSYVPLTILCDLPKGHRNQSSAQLFIFTVSLYNMINNFRASVALEGKSAVKQIVAGGSQGKGFRSTEKQMS